MYPEECLLERDIFVDAFKIDRISFSELKNESQKILIPWQMFLLSKQNLNKELDHIEEQREHKFSSKLISKRKGSGDVTSKRIIDRLIRQQNFLRTSGKYSINRFCGCLKGMDIDESVRHILTYFEIDRDQMWRYTSKKKALEYLITKVEDKNINVSRGVQANRILPSSKIVPGGVYKNTSGLVIKDDYVPFVFLPSEINPDEVEGRQIYTLIYLLVVIGLEEYDYILEKDFITKMIQISGSTRKLHDITTNLLMPDSEVEVLKGITVTETVRDTLSNKLKVTPSAFVVTLLMRKIISKREYDNLKPSLDIIIRQKAHARNPLVSTSVKKFCGELVTRAINQGLANGTLKNVQGQYLIWGMPNKKGMLEYRRESKL